MLDIDIETMLETMGVGLRTHSFRRALALSIRIFLFNRGFLTDKQIRDKKEILKRINKVFGWTSEQFFGYVKDFVCYFGVQFLTDQVILDFIVS